MTSFASVFQNSYTAGKMTVSWSDTQTVCQNDAFSKKYRQLAKQIFQYINEAQWKFSQEDLFIYFFEFFMHALQVTGTVSCYAQSPQADSLLRPKPYLAHSPSANHLHAAKF